MNAVLALLGVNPSLLSEGSQSTTTSSFGLYFKTEVIFEVKLELFYADVFTKETAVTCLYFGTYCYAC